MQRIIFFFILICLSDALSAQKLYPLKSANDSMVFRVIATKRKLQMVIVTGSDRLKTSGDFPIPGAFSLVNGDLQMSYTDNRKNKDLPFKFELWLETGEGQIIMPAPYDLEYVSSGTSGPLLIWNNFVELLPNFTFAHILHIRCAQMGSVNCEAPRPAFSIRQQLPYYAAGTGGVVLVGLSQVYRSQSKVAYTQYQERWRDGLEQPTDDENDLLKARRLNKQAQILLFSGIGIIGLDIVLYKIRGDKVRKKQRIYDKFCDNSSSFNLKLQGGASPGLSICHTW